MADVRVINNVVISDPTTPSQIAAVDASGRLSVNLTASSATVTVDTELTAVAALADATANPTITNIAAFNMLWNGATWDRGPGGTTGAFVQGNIAADGGVTARPLPGGGRASSAVPTAVSGDGDAVHVWLDRNGGTVVNGRDAHDAALDSLTNPQLIGGRSSAAAPTDVSADGDAVRAWFLRNGAQASVITAAGALIGGDATNGLDVDVTRVTGTVTVDSELPAAAALSDNFANPTAPGVGAFNMLWDSATWDRAPGTSTDGALVNLGTNNDVTVTSGNITADTELAAAAALADATANPTITQIASYLMGYNGTTWDRVRTANTGRLQVDVITGGGTETPTNAVNNYDTTSAVAAGASDNHDTTDFGAATKKVSAVIMGASVAMRGELSFVDNGTPTTLAVFFTQAGQTKTFYPPHRNFWSHTFTANAGADVFRLARTNLDASEAADVYSTILYED